MKTNDRIQPPILECINVGFQRFERKFKTETLPIAIPKDFLFKLQNNPLVLSRKDLYRFLPHKGSHQVLDHLQLSLEDGTIYAELAPDPQRVQDHFDFASNGDIDDAIAQALGAAVITTTSVSNSENFLPIVSGKGVRYAGSIQASALESGTAWAALRWQIDLKDGHRIPSNSHYAHGVFGIDSQIAGYIWVEGYGVEKTNTESGLKYAIRRI